MSRNLKCFVEDYYLFFNVWELLLVYLKENSKHLKKLFNNNGLEKLRR